MEYDRIFPNQIADAEYSASAGHRMSPASTSSVLTSIRLTNLLETSFSLECHGLCDSRRRTAPQSSNRTDPLEMPIRRNSYDSHKGIIYAVGATLYLYLGITGEATSEHCNPRQSLNSTIKSVIISPHTPFRLEDSLFDYLPIPPPSGPGFNNNLLGDSQFPYPTMQTSKEEEDMNDFTLEAMSTQDFTLFEPTGASISPPESSRLFASRSHTRNISAESASSFTTLVEGPLSPTSRHSALPARNTHVRSISAVSNCSLPYEPYPKQSPQSRKRANSDDEDHSEELEPLDPNATEEQKREYKRRQNTLAARRSRARRAQETLSLRDENARLKTDNAVWKERALMMERLLLTHGVPCPSFSS